MAGGTIFRKTSSDTENTTIPNFDSVLIINTGYAYQLPFEGLTDYNEIKITWLASYTSNSGDNVIGTKNENSGHDTNEDFSYIGFTYNDSTPNLPLTNGVDFIGIRFNRYAASAVNLIGSNPSRHLNDGLFADDTIPQDLVDYVYNNSGRNGKFGYYCTTDTTELCASYYPNAENIQDQPPNWRIGQGRLAQMDDNSAYWVYQGMGLKVIDKGLSTQKLRLKLYQTFDHTQMTPDSNADSWYNDNNGKFNNVAEKVDLPNLRAVTRGTDFLAEYQDIPWNKDGVALPLPDNFFYYNAFFNLRPRISTITGRVIS